MAIGYWLLAIGYRETAGRDGVVGQQLTANSQQLIA
jgi:hypothetical protein